MPNPQPIDLKQLGLILSRRRGTILIATFGCLALALAVNLLTRPTYVATVSMEVRKEPTRSPVTGEAIAADQWSSDLIVVFTAAELVTNRTFLREVLLKLDREGLVPRPTGLRLPFLSRATVAPGSPEDLNRGIDWLYRVTTVKPVRDTRLFNVQIEDSNPAAATRIADILANTYVTIESSGLAAADSSRAGLMAQQMEETGKRIQKLQDSLSGSSGKAPVVLTEQARQLTDAIGSLNESYVKLQDERLGVEARLARVRAALNDSLQDPSDLPLQSETLDVLWRNLLARQTELARAREVYREGHPKVVMLVTELRDIVRGIHAELARTVASLEREHTILLEREKSLQEAIALREVELSQVSKLLSQQTTTQTEILSSQTLYNLLTTRAQEEQVSGVVRNPLVRVVGSATVDSKPVRPHKALNMALGLIMGLLGGTGLALVQESLRRPIRTPGEASEQLEVPVFGMIPKRAETERLTILKRRPPTPTDVLEADYYASLGAEVERFVSSGKRKLLITSSGPAEGKSTIAAGLARILARLQGLKVVVVDADQIKARQHSLFGLSNTPGLGELLTGVFKSDPRTLGASRIGLGDWIELLYVQRRSGRLSVTEGERAYVIDFRGGEIVGLFHARATEDQALAEALTNRGILSLSQRNDALRMCAGSAESLAQVVVRLGYVQPEALQGIRRGLIDERLHGIRSMRHPQCDFAESEADDDVSQIPLLVAEGHARKMSLHRQVAAVTKRPYVRKQIEVCLQATELGNLMVLASGVATNEFMTRAGMAAFDRVLANLAEMFDIVIVDSPPIAVMSPAESISELVDGVLLVVKAGGFDVQVVRKAKDRLASRGVEVLAAVVNQVDLQHADPTLHYYYSYGRPGSSGGKPPVIHLPDRTRVV